MPFFGADAYSNCQSSVATAGTNQYEIVTYLVQVAVLLFSGLNVLVAFVSRNDKSFAKNFISLLRTASMVFIL